MILGAFSKGLAGALGAVLYYALFIVHKYNYCCPLKLLRYK